MPLPSLRAAGTCRHDLTALGEVMLRLDPREGRIRAARTFTAWEGGGEYNVARSLSRCFGLKTALVSALADNEIGHLVEGLILQGGVDASRVNWIPYDGIGRTVRNGLNFTERGFGVRGALGVSDRGHTAASQIRPGDIDWNEVFAPGETRWFHTGGVFAALSDSTAQVVLEAVAVLFDSLAVMCVPYGGYPFWFIVRPAARSLVIAIAAGTIETLLPLLRKK
jgi:2-dehydro-3-deoxygluconokinase